MIDISMVYGGSRTWGVKSSISQVILILKTIIDSLPRAVSLKIGIFKQDKKIKKDKYKIRKLFDKGN